MEDGQFREAESEEQKSLPFNFRAPRLQLTQDKSQARIFWQSQGQIIADHKEQMVKKWEEEQDIFGFIMDGCYRCTTKTANATGRSWKGHLLVEHVQDDSQGL